MTGMVSTWDLLQLEANYEDTNCFRFKSRYYWHRVDFQSKSWFNNYHLIEPDADPRDRDYW